uniref:Uncharacterized protein n=1 Tax=Octopus bimaculoides TaxID=37653 RepID=A0A0L8I1U5_OCTBM
MYVCMHKLMFEEDFLTCSHRLKAKQEFGIKLNATGGKCVAVKDLKDFTQFGNTTRIPADDPYL